MAIDKSEIKRLAYQRGMVVSVDDLYVMSADEFEAYTRSIEQAVVAELLAEVGMAPAKGQYFICTKCGMHGAGSGSFHVRHDGVQCGYMAHSEGPYYTADQLAAAIAAAKAEQREKDANRVRAVAEFFGVADELAKEIDAYMASDAISEGGC